eukprot:354820-Chlamydomonas_euryale.AAC.5
MHASRAAPHLAPYRPPYRTIPYRPTNGLAFSGYAGVNAAKANFAGWGSRATAGVLHVCVTGLSGGMLEAGCSLGSSHLAGCMGACITEFYGRYGLNWGTRYAVRLLHLSR